MMLALKILGYWTLVSILVTPVICQCLFDGPGLVTIVKDGFRAIRMRRSHGLVHV